VLVIVFTLALSPGIGRTQATNNLSTIPRIDVHAHVGDLENMAKYVEIRKIVMDEYNVDLAMWINVSSPLGPRGEGIEYLEEVEKTYKGRFLTCLTNHNISKGLKFSPEEVGEWKDRGVVGYKIWVGVSPAINDPANDATLSKMEQIGLPGASVHISQPYPTSWCEDPVKFWEAQNAWARVLDRHPNFIVINAHMLDFFNSDEQLDYLIYMFETYPNLNVDLAARFKQFLRMDWNKLREFMIKYSDRVVFGTDIGKIDDDAELSRYAERYNKCFQLLETDKLVKGGFFGQDEMKGLNLPREVLENIYYKNTMRLYPRVKEVLVELGYEVE
jgi:predicted TIM-barrel fold metal-dependent hydrolase